MSLLLGLTGGIGSGKSLAAKFFKELGAYIIDADKLSRELVRPGQPALNEIIENFGDDILDSNGNLNRGELAKIIFKDANKKSSLENILHPKIIKMEQEEYARISNSDSSAIVIIEAALLIESENYKNVDKVIVIQSNEAQQLDRILSRSDLNRDQAEARIKNQMKLEEKNKFADFLLENNSTPEILRQNVHELYKKIQALNN